MKANHQINCIARKLSWRYLIINFISAYQRFISPRKGFVCAHRRLNGGMSCSEYAKTVIGRCKLNIALRLFWRRLRLCQKASYVIRKEKNPAENTENGKNSDSDDSVNEAVDAACCLVDAASCIGDLF